MDIGTATVVASAIPVIGGIVGLAIKEFRDMRQENRQDHGAVMAKLNQVQLDHGAVIRKINKVQEGVEKVAERLDDHIDWHLKK